MQYRPSDTELLEAVASLFEDEVLPVVPAALRHQVRVAVNLIRIVQRQEGLSPVADERERDRLAHLLGASGQAEEQRSLPELRADLDARLRQARLGQKDAALDAADVWGVLVATARDDLSVAKPGYDQWELG